MVEGSKADACNTSGSRDSLTHQFLSTSSGVFLQSSTMEKFKDVTKAFLAFH